MSLRFHVHLSFKFSIFQIKSCALWEGNKPAFFNTSIDWSWQWLVVKRECPVYLTQCEYQILCFACGLSLQSPEPAQAFIWNHRNQDSLNDTTKHTPGRQSWANSLPLAQSRLLSFSLHQPNLHPFKFFPPLSITSRLHSGWGRLWFHCDGIRWYSFDPGAAHSGFQLTPA